MGLKYEVEELVPQWMGLVFPYIKSALQLEKAFKAIPAGADAAARMPKDKEYAKLFALGRALREHAHARDSVPEASKAEELFAVRLEWIPELEIQELYEDCSSHVLVEVTKKVKGAGQRLLEESKGAMSGYEHDWKAGLAEADVEQAVAAFKKKLFGLNGAQITENADKLDEALALAAKIEKDLVSLDSLERMFEALATEREDKSELLKKASALIIECALCQALIKGTGDAAAMRGLRQACSNVGYWRGVEETDIHQAIYTEA
ncbi:unnamed protein product, partial [Symbiodinium sp. CCMP2456]